MQYLKLILDFIFNFILNNRIKTLFVILSTILFNYAGSIPDKEKEFFIIKSIDIGDKYKNRYVYIYETSFSSEIKMEIINFETPQELINNKLNLLEYNELNVVLWVLFVVSSLLFIIPSFMYSDDYLNWDEKRIWRDSLKSTIYSELENDIYYYMSFGRLIHKSEKLLNPESVMRNTDINSLSDIKSMPKFKTKSLKRESILKQIGI